MPLTGDYEPSRKKWVRDQVERYEATGGREANTLRDTGLPVALFTMRGAKSGKIRKIALMRVEHGGAYAMVASDGGAQDHPGWVHNVRAHPDQLVVQDGPEPFDATARELEGEERRPGGSGRSRPPELCGVPATDRAADPGVPGRTPIETGQIQDQGGPTPLNPDARTTTHGSARTTSDPSRPDPEMGHRPDATEAVRDLAS